MDRKVLEVHLWEVSCELLLIKSLRAFHLHLILICVKCIVGSDPEVSTRSIRAGLLSTYTLDWSLEEPPTSQKTERNSRLNIYKILIFFSRFSLSKLFANSIHQNENSFKKLHSFNFRSNREEKKQLQIFYNLLISSFKSVFTPKQIGLGARLILLTDLMRFSATAIKFCVFFGVG